MKGQQIIVRILEVFRTNDKLGHFYGILDLARVQFTTDGEMDMFRDRWDHYVDNMREPLKDEQLAEILLEQLEKSEVLKPDIDNYKRMKDDDENKTYSYLLESMDRHLSLMAKKCNRDASCQ